MPTQLKSNLSLKELNQLKKDIRKYQKEYVNEKLQEFVEALCDEGIRVAYQNTHPAFAPFIGFVKEVNPSKYNYKCTGIMIGRNERINMARWVRGYDFVEEEVNSLLMTEYGSGLNARIGWQGTFPNQTHANEPYWWYATEIDANGRPTNWHKGTGVKPTRPMYKAWLDMIDDYDRVAYRVFVN